MNHFVWNANANSMLFPYVNRNQMLCITCFNCWCNRGRHRWQPGRFRWRCCAGIQNGVQRFGKIKFELHDSVDQLTFRYTLADHIPDFVHAWCQTCLVLVVQCRHLEVLKNIQSHQFIFQRILANCSFKLHIPLSLGEVWRVAGQLHLRLHPPPLRRCPDALQWMMKYSVDRGHDRTAIVVHRSAIYKFRRPPNGHKHHRSHRILRK